MGSGSGSRRGKKSNNEEKNKAKTDIMSQKYQKNKISI
jgi:hypothetical protein